MFFCGNDDSLFSDETWMENDLPTDAPVLLIASIAYSICCNLPSGVNVVVLESYRLDILNYF